MRVGLDLGLYKQSLPASGPIAPPPPPSPTDPPVPEPGTFGPISGILDAPNVVILGASIMQGAFGANGSERASLRTCATAAGFTGTLHSYAVSGHSITDARARFATAKSDLSADEGANVYIAHIGGNNVSSARPFPGGQTNFESDCDDLIADVTATDTFLPLPLTKRLYGKGTDPAYSEQNSVIPGDAASEDNGSKPYNDNIIIPRIGQIMPDWLDDNGVPFVNPYSLAHQFPELTGSDGIHGYGASIARYILAKVAGRAHGIASGASRAGKSLVYDIGKGDPNGMTWGSSYNTWRNMGGGNNFLQSHPYLWGAASTDGGFDPDILIYPSGAYQNNSGYTSEAFARLADTRFHHAAIVGNGIYVQGTQEFVLNIEGLTPGDTMVMHCAGVRGAGGAGRRGDVTLVAGTAQQTRTLDASNAATSNQISFDPIVVPASGTATLSLKVSAGSTYGYLHGIAIDFS